MGIVERDFDVEDLHPIDIVETLAEERSWDFDRIADDQIAMAIEGSWRTYSVTLAWSAHDESLRLICAFDMAPPARRVAALIAGDVPRQRPLLDRRLRALARPEADGLPLQPESRRRRDRRRSAQITDMVRAAVAACERFYPAFQLVAWGGETPGEGAWHRDFRSLRSRLTTAPFPAGRERGRFP